MTKKYVGIHNDINGGMTDTGKIIRDAWVFGIIPETETCEGWLYHGINDLWDKVSKAWEPYGHSVSALPDDLKDRFLRIHNEAFQNAKAQGWDPEKSLYDDS